MINVAIFYALWVQT